MRTVPPLIARTRLSMSKRSKYIFHQTSSYIGNATPELGTRPPPPPPIRRDQPLPRHDQALLASPGHFNERVDVRVHARHRGIRDVLPPSGFDEFGLRVDGAETESGGGEYRGYP